MSFCSVRGGRVGDVAADADAEPDPDPEPADNTLPLVSFRNGIFLENPPIDDVSADPASLSTVARFTGDEGGEMNRVGGDLDTIDGLLITLLPDEISVMPGVNPSSLFRAAPGDEPNVGSPGLRPPVSSLMSMRGFVLDRAGRLTLDLECRADAEDIALPGLRGATRVARGASSSESESESESDVGLERVLGREEVNFVEVEGEILAVVDPGLENVDASRTCCDVPFMSTNSEAVEQPGSVSSTGPIKTRKSIPALEFALASTLARLAAALGLSALVETLALDLAALKPELDDSILGSISGLIVPTLALWLCPLWLADDDDAGNRKLDCTRDDGKGGDNSLFLGGSYGEPCPISDLARPLPTSRIESPSELFLCVSVLRRAGAPLVDL